MHIAIPGARLYVDIEGIGLDAARSKLRAKPTLVLLHGGPGADHTMFKPDFAALSDIAQIVYFDMRGHGRSTIGTPAQWTLAQWGDDVKSLCDSLGISKPIVLGLSFGGFVAQAYATRHPKHPAALILISTAARMPAPNPPPLATTWRGPLDPANRARAQRRAAQHTLRRPEPYEHFTEGERTTFDFRRQLPKIRCPTLILSGTADTLTSPQAAQELAGRIPHSTLHFLHNAQHIAYLDAPKPAFRTIRRFIAGAPK
jgi:proline iminopeptidase